MEEDPFVAYQEPQVDDIDPRLRQRALSRRMSFRDQQARARGIEEQQRRARQRDARPRQPWTNDRVKSCVAMAYSCSCGFVIFFCLAIWLRYEVKTNGPTIKECSPYQYKALYYQWIFIIYMAVRNFPWCMISVWCQKPQTVYNGLVFVQGSLIDSIGLMILNVYVSIWLSKGVESCTKDQVSNWNTIALTFNILFWIYNSLWLFIFGVACFIGSIVACIFCCANRAQGRRNVTINGRSLDELRTDVAQRVPGASDAIEMLDNKKHDYAASSDAAKQVTMCCICYEDFKDTDEVVELQCDDRHIFHFDCISRWMVTKTECPTCRQKVAVN